MHRNSVSLLRQVRHPVISGKCGSGKIFNRRSDLAGLQKSLRALD